MNNVLLRKAQRAFILARRIVQEGIARATGNEGPVVFDAPNEATTYDKYLERQKEKTLDRAEKLKGPLWHEKLEGFRDLFQRYHDIITPGQSALCIGARTGQEVIVLKELGMDAIGIDLVEFPPHVIVADMHNLPFEDRSFDFVFTNVFDHSPQPKNMISEMERVTKPGGHCALWLQLGYTTDPYSENQLHRPQAAIDLFKQSNVVWSKSDQTIFDGMNHSILTQRL